MKTKLVIFALATLGLFACTAGNSPSDPNNPNNPVTKNGTLSGKFTVNEQGNQVQFSQGNLQYQASSSTWRFAENQYDIIGADNDYISETYDGWIDLFGWGTGDNPTLASKDNSDYPTFVDWGVNMITNGGNTANNWRTLAAEEWKYLLSTRNNASNLKGQATVNEVHGYILLPDKWTLPSGLSFTARPDDYDTNVYDAVAWSKMESAGAVFLPAAGARGYTVPSLVGGVDKYGRYSSSTPYEDRNDGTWRLGFGDNYANVAYTDRFWGQSVRLVR